MDPDQIIKILVLEDDAEDYHLLQCSLRDQKKQFALDWATTLSEAMKKCDRHHYDVILADLSLPDSAGIETVARLRRVCGNTPILVLTGLDDASVEEELLVAGAQDYLLKQEFGGRTVSRAIVHAHQRQQSINEVHTLVQELVQSHQLLEKQTRLLHRKNRRLKRLYKTAKEFVDNVSHDFRTPLTVIKDYVAIIREGMVGEINDEQKNMLDKVSVRADDLNYMVDDLLDVSKLESGLLSVYRRNVDIAEVLQRTESMFEQRASAKNVQLIVEWDKNLPQVYCDADKVGRVITNLAINAIKFAGEEGCVRIVAEANPAGNEVRISVIDNGPGIDRQSLDQIFRRFRQLKTHVKSTIKGFGLGLNIAQQLCRLNLGELSVKSQLGQGSTFSFTLPVADPVEVLDRWLHLQSTPKEAFKLVRIRINEDSTTAEAEEFDSFVHCLLRRKDLLVRVNANEWMLIMNVHLGEADRWYARIHREYERTNRNRPFGPLPQYHAKTCREWNAYDSHDLILKQFSAVLESRSLGEEPIKSMERGEIDAEQAEENFSSRR